MTPQDDYVSPDGILRLVVARDEDGDISLGFAGFAWHVHGELLVAAYAHDDVVGLTPESATRRFVQEVTGNRAIIVMQRVDGVVRDIWVTSDPSRELRCSQPGASLEFRHWDGSGVPV